MKSNHCVKEGRQLTSGISTVNLRAVLILLAVVGISSGVKVSLVQAINISSMYRLDTPNC